MKDFTIGQVSNDVIEHGDNYYRSRTGQADYNQFSTEGRWIFRFFRRHFCIDHRHNCFPIGRHSPFIACSVRINCLSYFYRGVSVPREFINPVSCRISVCGNKNTISSASVSPTAINYRTSGIIRRKPPKVLIKPVIHPLDFRRLKTTIPNWHGPGALICST